MFSRFIWYLTCPDRANIDRATAIQPPRQPIGRKHSRCAAKKAGASAVFATERLDAAADSGAADATGALSCMLVATGAGAGRAGTLIWGGLGGKLTVSLGTVGVGGGTRCVSCRAL